MTLLMLSCVFLFSPVVFLYPPVFSCVPLFSCVLMWSSHVLLCSPVVLPGSVLIQKRLKKEKKTKRRLQEALEVETKLRDQAEQTLHHTGGIDGLTQQHGTIHQSTLTHTHQHGTHMLRYTHAAVHTYIQTTAQYTHISTVHT